VDWNPRGRPPLGDPIEVVDYDAAWGELFRRERERVRAALGPLAAGVPGRQFFRTNPRTRHLHVVEHGGEEWRRLIAFRGYLRTHPEVVREYEALKRRLAADHPRERARYTEGKAAFIEAVVRRARPGTNGTCASPPFRGGN
jgi:GrpB-like predicted nucleotidyltransferase (UPF0157 family)